MALHVIAELDRRSKAKNTRSRGRASESSSCNRPKLLTPAASSTTISPSITA
jgi:hypothetical protein